MRVRLGVDQELLRREALRNIIAMEREMGRLMKAHVEETFHCRSEEKKNASTTDLWLPPLGKWQKQQPVCL